MLAVVLARKNMREFDQTVSLYTRDVGKLEVLAKGIKKIVSKNSANLQTLSVVDVEIIQGKDIDYLGRVQPVRMFTGIYGDLDKIYLAQYIASLVDAHILAGEKDEAIFSLLIEFFDFLNTCEFINSHHLVTAFIFKLWHRLGFVDVDSEASEWVEANWSAINKSTVSQTEVMQVYEKACRFAEFHAGVKLAKFMEHDRIL